MHRLIRRSFTQRCRTEPNIYNCTIMSSFLSFYLFVYIANGRLNTVPGHCGTCILTHLTTYNPMPDAEISVIHFFHFLLWLNDRSYSKTDHRSEWEVMIQLSTPHTDPSASVKSNITYDYNHYVDNFSIVV